MALQNALGNLALDASIQALITALQTNTAAAQATQAATEHQGRMFPPRALQYARDTSDRMLVSVASVPATTIIQPWGNQNAWVAWYSTGAPATMDARETQREMSQQTFNDVRRARWVIT